MSTAEERDIAKLRALRAIETHLGQLVDIQRAREVTTAEARAEQPSLEMRPGALFRRANGSELRLIEPAYTHHDLHKFCLSLATLAPGMWVAELTAPNGVVEACLITAENLIELGYTPAEVTS